MKPSYHEALAEDDGVVKPGATSDVHPIVDLDSSTNLMLLSPRGITSYSRLMLGLGYLMFTQPVMFGEGYHLILG